MSVPLSRRRVLGLAVSLPVLPLAMAGCAASGTTASAGGAILAQAPVYRISDRWIYRIDQQFRAAPDFDETVEVTGIGADGITARVTTKGGDLDVARTERWSAPGLVVQGALMDIETRRFAEPLQRLRFPLASGERWNQWVDQVNDTGRTSGPINRHVTINRAERVSVPAGTFDAVRMTVIQRLDDETPFRYATECSYIVWYAPAVRGIVREERRASYLEKGSGRDAGGRIAAQNEIVQLVAFRPGA